MRVLSAAVVIVLGVSLAPVAALAQSEPKHHDGATSSSFQHAGDQLKDGARRFGEGIKNGAIGVWEAVKGGAQTVGDKLRGPEKPAKSHGAAASARDTH